MNQKRFRKIVPDVKRAIDSKLDLENSIGSRIPSADLFPTSINDPALQETETK